MKLGAGLGHSLRVDTLLGLVQRPVEQSMPESAAAVYERHADFVFRSLQHLGAREVDLEDLMQEVFVVVHRRLHTFNGSSKLTTWLFGICFRVVARQRRRAYLRWERQTDALPEVSDEHTPEDRYSDDQARRLIERVLGKLSLERRAVFVLFEVEGQSCHEIAELLGVPVGTVHSRLHTARREVARAFARIGATARKR